MKPVSGKRFCKALRKAGWFFISSESSHRKYEHPDGRMVIVPVHGNKDLRTGTQAALMKQAGLTDKDL